MYILHNNMMRTTPQDNTELVIIFRIVGCCLELVVFQPLIVAFPNLCLDEVFMVRCPPRFNVCALRFSVLA